MRIFIKGKPRPHWGEDQKLELADMMGEHYTALEGPVTLRMRFIFEDLDPRGHVPVTEAPLPALIRGTLDQLCGLGWKNEKQIVAVHAIKEFGNTSGVQVSW